MGVPVPLPRTSDNFRNRLTASPSLAIHPTQLGSQFDRESFPFTHNLHTLPLFALESVNELAARFTRLARDYFVAAGAAAPGTPFYAVPHGDLSPAEALRQLHTRSVRVVLKRPENHDPRFRELLNTLFAQLRALNSGIARAKIVRLESALLITSPSTITPLHFDPEIGFFSQITGEKIYHVYSPADVSEPELERFYIGGVVDIGSIEMARRNPARERVYTLLPGNGFHQPQNSPHWVETGKGRSVSYTFVFETELSRARNRIRAFNYYQRKLGLPPSRPGAHHRADHSKSALMRAVIPVRQLAGATLRRFRDA